MIGKVKQWLGIEGVKLELILPTGFKPTQGTLHGKVRLVSKSEQTVTAIKLVIVEKYSRGRDEEQLVDEYELGRQIITDTIAVPAEGVPVEVPFLIEFSPVQSPVDEFGRKNFLFGGIAWAARKLRNASSEYRVEAEAQVRGVGLNPFDKKILE
jgi:hypothetical protein